MEKYHKWHIYWKEQHQVVMVSKVLNLISDFSSQQVCCQVQTNFKKAKKYVKYSPRFIDSFCGFRKILYFNLFVQAFLIFQNY